MKKVLLINPDSDSLASCKNVLDRDELRIFTATTAEEGLRIHREERVDLIITELALPVMGGDMLCARIRQEYALRKVSLVVVCRDVPEEIARAKSCHANARLLKPVTPEELVACVGKLLAVPKRRSCRVLVRAQLCDERGETTLFGVAHNISVAGLLIESDDLLAVGDRIACLFFLPDARPINAVGEVARAVRQSRIMTQYGIRFIHLYPQVRSEIENFVAANTMAA
jgi:CheY-like chemotaxis protein